MKTLRSLTYLFVQWRGTCQHLRKILPSSLSELPANIATRCLHSPTPKLDKSRKRPPVALVLAVVSITGTMGQRFYNTPKLDVGTRSGQTILAPYKVSIEDTKATDEKRKAARTKAVPVLILNQDITQKIYADLERTLDFIDQIRTKTGDFPFEATSILSTAAQLDLRTCSEKQWQTVLSVLNTNQPKSSIQQEFSQTEDNLSNISFSTILELQLYSQSAGSGKLKSLIAKITQARQLYTKAIAAFSASKYSTAEAQTLLNLTDSQWMQTRTGIRDTATRMFTQGIPPGLSPSILEDAVKVQLSSLVAVDTEAWATKLLLQVLQPNLIEDREQTRAKAELAAQAVKPVMLSLKQGEVIVYEGEIISRSDFLLLDYLNLSRREMNWSGMVGFGGLVGLSIGIFWIIQKRFHPRMRQRDHLVVLLLALSTSMLVKFGPHYTNLPVVGLLVSSFYGSALGMTTVGLLSSLLIASTTISKHCLIASTVGSLVGALIAGRMRSREELALLGGAVGLTQGCVYLILKVIFTEATGLSWYLLLQEAALYGLSGLVWGIVALGLSPYLEHLFDLITPIRLAELSNHNRPLLKRLAAETPGTFQHTLFVANLAEAAARKLGCNVELVRAGTLYHDIGKMHDPAGFIENQMGNPNKHDKINNPWKSAEIIKKHVSEGLVMARKYRLPKAIRAFIPEHQGTIQIAYFYHQAQQLAQQDPNIVVREEDFRYDGPIPQSKETGIVMLADACEAALRSLKDANPELALSTINKILHARWQDKQLIDSGLTREEISILAAVFVEVWQQYNHQRIAYPKAALSPR